MEKLDKKPVIILVGIETKIYEYLDTFIGAQYLLFPVDQVDQFENIAENMDIRLFLIDTDKPWLGIKEILEKIKSSSIFQNIPVIGLALKKHFKEMEIHEKHLYEDFLLIPCSNEDLLTRIEVWTRTYGVMCKDEIQKKTFSLDNL